MSSTCLKLIQDIIQRCSVNALNWISPLKALYTIFNTPIHILKNSANVSSQYASSLVCLCVGKDDFVNGKWATQNYSSQSGGHLSVCKKTEKGTGMCKHWWGIWKMARIYEQSEGRSLFVCFAHQQFVSNTNSCSPESHTAPLMVIFQPILS